MEYCKSKEGCFKRVSLEAGRAFHQASFFVEASYVVALCIAEAKVS